MKHVLVVEDEQDLRMLYRMEFEAEGYDVDTADDVPEALQHLQEQDTDVVILDLRLPGKSGLELLKEMRSCCRRVPVVINTAYDFYRYDFTTWGAEVFLIKSGDMTSLKDAVAKLVHKAEILN